MHIVFFLCVYHCIEARGGLCLQAFFGGEGCSCSAPLEDTICLRHTFEMLEADICWEDDKLGLLLLFKSFTKLAKEAGLQLKQPAYFNNQGKMGVGLQRVN